MHQHALWQGNKTIYFPGCMCQLTQENNLFPRMHDVSVDSASGMWGGGGRLSHCELIKSIDTCTSLLGSCLLELILNEVTYGHISYWFHLSTRQNHHLERYTIASLNPSTCNSAFWYSVTIFQQRKDYQLLPAPHHTPLAGHVSPLSSLAPSMSLQD